MALIKYKRSSGSYIDIVKQKAQLPPTTFTVMPSNAKVNDRLGYKRQKGSRKFDLRNNLGVNSFTFNMQVMAEQTSDPEVAIDNFWYLPMVMVWATDVKVMTGYWLDAHVTWYQTKSIGKTTSNAPKLEGMIYMTTTNPMNQTEDFSAPLAYLPFNNQIKV